ncbi:hypothetical protein SAMN04487866_1253 [Thermoactinomyces sp. DSM 45891]|nr:hypothetical protein SAMN04487866_1253 [Thermoactinomyces sp. DSM 45891]
MMWDKLGEALKEAAKKGTGNQINIATGHNSKIIATKITSGKKKGDKK